MKKQEKDGLVWYTGEIGSGKDREKVVHGFTTRYGGVSEGHFASLNLAVGRGDVTASVGKNYEKVNEVLGIVPKKYARNAQVHGDVIHVLGTGEGLSFQEMVASETAVLGGDGLVTAEKDVMLWVYSADCVPILYYDSVNQVIGAVHGGWRGTALGISVKMVTLMAEKFGTSPQELQVVIGPSIGACCFTCSEDVPVAMEQSFGTEILEFCPKHPSEAGKYAVNLQGIHQYLLKKAGVLQIDCEPPCTACDLDSFWSHRKVGDARGVQGGFIMLKGEEHL